MSEMLEKLRQQFAKNENQNSGGNRGGNQYPFWNIPMDSSATIRFLPDKNKDNPMLFLVEKRTHKLVINGENKTVPCLRMYGEDCPICKVSSDYYNAKDEVNGKKFYRKIQHLAQALIIKDPIAYKEDEESALNTVKILTMDFKLYNIIKNVFASGELDEVPFAYAGGTDFIITKSQQGKYSDYSLSRFARKSTDLTDEQIEYCEEHLVDLSTLLPGNPGIEKVESMLRAALTGGTYDGDGDKSDGDDEAEDNSASRTFVKPATPAPAESNDDEDDDNDEILAAVRRRRQQRAQAAD